MGDRPRCDVGTRAYHPFGCPHQPCEDCGWCTLTETYMVRSEVWAEAHPEGWKGFLCVGCLETRLGRELAPGDFDGLSELPWVSKRLRSRDGRLTRS